MCATMNHYQLAAFRSRFLHGTLAVNLDQDLSQSRQLTAEALCGTPGPAMTRPQLGLDLRGLGKDDTPSEGQLRRQKLQYFDKHCSEVFDGLFLSGDNVAKSRETLAASGVTHVVNCVGFLCKEYFKDELTYKTYYLQGKPAAEHSLQAFYRTLLLPQSFADSPGARPRLNSAQHRLMIRVSALAEMPMAHRGKNAVQLTRSSGQGYTRVT